ncbi:hypothetical protein CB0940_07958 [Cercospora beticola]|uniref:Uncharacterized protein n=1 Tax=Cercospora beticola TaxID=122368 RepID=A0A2G5HA44_CERBT|nr:hypothetical protein CB0940_07958 [Cercospora beticola]PIA89399.1 hypothetical protein CB0940_07958 [Cercospora beticola]WPB08539.1 hypothetical protein RHO25_013205 [Cercospora beticola]CAK1356596.1 unnamed protein product [Cercospora beticola]
MPPKASYKPYLPQIEAFFKENELSSPYDLNATLFNQAYDLARLARPASDKQMANFFKYLNTTFRSDAQVSGKGKLEAELIKESLASYSADAPAASAVERVAAPEPAMPISDDYVDDDMSDAHDLAGHGDPLEPQHAGFEASRMSSVECEANLKQKEKALELEVSAQIAHWKQEVEQQRSENQALKSKTEALSNANAAYKQQVTVHLQKVASLTDSNAGLVLEISDLTKANDALSKLAAENEKLTKANAAITKQKLELAEKATSLVRKQAESDSKIGTLEMNLASEAAQLCCQRDKAATLTREKNELQQALEQYQSAVVLPASFIPAAVREHAQELRAHGSEEAKLEFRQACEGAASGMDCKALQSMLLRARAGVDGGMVFQSLKEIKSIADMLRGALPLQE